MACLEPQRKGGGTLLMLSVRIPKRNSEDNTKMNLREVGRWVLHGSDLSGNIC